MKEVRYGIVGCGGMGSSHVKGIVTLERCRLTACADSAADNVKKIVDAHDGVKGFDCAEAMYDSGLIDAVLIATPHYFHPPLMIAALERGIHVMTEKPVAVTAKAAQEMNDAAEKSGVKYSVMYQYRAYDLWLGIKQHIDSGKLGKLQRITWIITDWFRTQNYYDKGGWRATWKGEGGGVLLNQCPHNLDLICWLCGQPSLVDARIRLGEHHNIEVEDEVSAYLEWPDGATGNFITSTGEWPGTNRLEIVGDKGRIIIEPKASDDGFTYDKFDSSVHEHIKTAQRGFGGPEVTREQITTGNGGSHIRLHQNFVNAILDNEPLKSPGTQGIESVELINAMIMSGIERKPVELPMDRDAYEQLMQRLIKDADARG